MSKSVGKAIQVLDLFSIESPEWGVNEVARRLKLPKSTVSELMSTLADQKLLSRTTKGRYRLGWKLFELSQALLDTTEFRIEARRLMKELVRTWEETMHLAVLDGVQAVYIEKLQQSPAIKIRITRAGARLPAHSSGVGKVLLAHRDLGDIAGPLDELGLPALTLNTITDLDALADELQQVRERGYAYDEEESLVGLCCVAAPIFGPENEVVAAISLSVPAFRFQSKRDRYTDTIIEAARRITERAGPGLTEYLR